MLYDSYFLIPNISFLLQLLHAGYAFSNFSLLFQKLHCSKTWKKIFKIPFCFFTSSAFISMGGFIQAFWWNLITLCTFFNINSWFSACCKFRLYVKYSFLSCKLAKCFSTFSIFNLSGENGKLWWRSYIFTGY